MMAANMKNCFDLRQLFGTVIICLLFMFSTARAEQIKEYDVVVYGGTSAGVVSAVKSARLGATVALIEPGKHLGGLSSAGLGFTDAGKTDAIGGIARDFYCGVNEYYDAEYENQPKWVFEPHIAEKVFNDFVNQPLINVFMGQRLDLKNGVTKKDGRIIAIKMESGQSYHGKMFVDATYEGDLMALAGVSYSVGRESNSQYNETLNGVQVAHAKYHQFPCDIDPYVVPGDPASGLLYGITEKKPAQDGQGDKLIQAYCYRLCLTDDPANMVPFTKPAGFDSSKYELLIRYANGCSKLKPFFTLAQLPNRKTDSNNKGPFSFDYIGMNYDYPLGDYATRERIAKEHEIYQRGLLWVLANDPRVPQSIRDTVSKWGLAKDEFLDNDNWPHQLYVREARRMVSDYVMTEHNCLGKEDVSDSVGLASYPMDSHHVQRYVDEAGYVRNEGDVEVGKFEPFAISYRSIVPKKSECENLLVPVCVSSSHIAYGSIRMEPVFMILGESAASAAVMAIKNNIAVQDVDYKILSKELLSYGQILSWAVNSGGLVNKKANKMKDEPLTSVDLPIIPKPVSVKSKNGKFVLEKVVFIHTSDSRLDSVADLIRDELEIGTTKDPDCAQRIFINLLKDDPQLGAEGYSLSVNPDEIVICANTPTGAYYAVQTILQLAAPAGDKAQPLSIPAVEITDYPRFPIRAFMLDSSREFQDKEFIKELITRISSYKINTLHWHPVDDESWRLEIKKYPQLTQCLPDRKEAIVLPKKDPQFGGNMQSQGYYTQEDVKEIIAFAASKHVLVIPEIEMPGHSIQAVNAINGVMCEGLKQNGTVLAREYCLGSEKTVEFLQDVIDETIELFESSPYIHIGGDEAKTKHWEQCQLCQNKMKELGLTEEGQLQKWFMDKMTRYVHSKGKTSIAWADDLQAGIPADQIVHAWRRSDETITALRQGHKVINSQNGYVYLDYPMSDASIKADWMPYLRMDKVYKFNPVPADATPEQAKLVLGSAAPLWTESVPQNKVYEKIFPRLFAFSEVVWTPQEQRLDYSDFLKRSKVHCDRFDLLNIPYEK